MKPLNANQINLLGMVRGCTGRQVVDRSIVTTEARANMVPAVPLRRAASMRTAARSMRLYAPSPEENRPGFLRTLPWAFWLLLLSTQVATGLCLGLLHHILSH